MVIEENKIIFLYTKQHNFFIVFFFNLSQTLENIVIFLKNAPKISHVLQNK